MQIIEHANPVSPMVIVDVDITIVDTDMQWLKWLNTMSGRNTTPETFEWEYNVGQFFKNDLTKYHLDPFDFWRSDNIYDTLKPYPGVRETLEQLHNIGYDIVFASHIKGDHHKSKYNFLKRYFGDIMAGFVATKEKHLIRSGTGKDIIIDDRFEYLNQSDAAVKVWFKNSWKQSDKKPHGVYLLDDWDWFNRNGLVAFLEAYYETL
jgi:5'(3')-deoxyribonucleotidase